MLFRAFRATLAPDRNSRKSKRREIRAVVYYIGKLFPFPGEFDLSLSAAHYYRAVLDAVAAAAAYRVRVSLYP